MWFFVCVELLRLCLSKFVGSFLSKSTENVDREAFNNGAHFGLFRLRYIRGRHQADLFPVHADGHRQFVRLAAASARRSCPNRKRSASAQRRSDPGRCFCPAAQSDAYGIGERSVASHRPGDAGPELVQFDECADAERE